SCASLRTILRPPSCTLFLYTTLFRSPVYFSVLARYQAVDDGRSRHRLAEVFHPVRAGNVFVHMPVWIGSDINGFVTDGGDRPRAGRTRKIDRSDHFLRLKIDNHQLPGISDNDRVSDWTFGRVLAECAGHDRQIGDLY